MPIMVSVTPRSPESLEMKARLKAVGNSVNPQTVAEIGRAVMAAEAAFSDSEAA